ncbi:hypothetical protein TWF281_002292 [Arthrobotrys megalospora]
MQRAETNTQSIYPHPFDRASLLKQSSREKAIHELSIAFRDQPNWTEKLTDRTLFTAWLRQSMKEIRKRDYIDPYNPRDTELRPDDTKFLYSELSKYRRYVLKLREGEAKEGIEPDVDGVWRRDGILDENWRKKLVDATTTLENTPNKERGLPASGSKGFKSQVLDPDMYPFVYKKTLALEKDGKYFELAVPPPSKWWKGGYNPYASWLPSEFKIAKDGNSTKIVSYINNLTLPGQEALFHPIFEKVFTEFLPLFNHVLADLAGKGCSRERSSKFECFDMEDMPFFDSDEEEFNNPWTPPEIVSSRELEGKTVKIIVRLVEMNLAPRKSYISNNSDWNVDGMGNERIVATGIYQYEQGNVKDYLVPFRQRDFYSFSGPDAMDDEFSYANVQWKTRHNAATTMKGNRGIVFPNLYEHRLPSSLELVDRNKPGFVKLLIFHLCDPTIEDLPSTRTVPPQQPGQLEHLLRQTRALGRLPEEIFQLILSHVVGNIMTMKEASVFKGVLVSHKNNVLEGGLGQYR